MKQVFRDEGKSQILLELQERNHGKSVLYKLKKFHMCISIKQHLWQNIHVHFLLQWLPFTFAQGRATVL